MQKRFSFPPLPRTALAIAAAAALALSGCVGSSGSGTPAESYAASGQTGSPSNASSDAASEQARFDAFLAHQFQESVQDDPLTLHFLVRNPENYGITEPEMKFPEYSLVQLQKDSEENAAVLEELSSFDTSLLTSDQLFTYRMMKDTLETEARPRPSPSRPRLAHCRRTSRRFARQGGRARRGRSPAARRERR